jgi:S1-C subfamily serine protease
MHRLSVIKWNLFGCLFVTAAILFSYNSTAQTQQHLQIPDSELSIRGVAQKSSVYLPSISSSVYVDFSSAKALGTEFKEVVPRTRGPQDISLFRLAAPSVVLILVKDALGSGALLQDNIILTNFHVVDHNREVTVVFKPADPSGKPTQDEVVKGDVIKIDGQRDLALVRPRSLPNRALRPLQIASTDIEVGADVAAIGHPEGEQWTYTKGIVSQIRPNFEWSTGHGDSHRATVIQTQTPINPGNSGGPLLSDDGKIVGINSFAATGAQGLNFAVAAKDINYFLKNQSSGGEPLNLNPCNQAKTIFEGRNQNNTAFIRQVSTQCDDTADITFVAPDDRSDPFLALVDLKRRGKPEGIVFDFQRSGKRWDTSFWDSQLDDTFPLKGIHPDGKLMPTSFVPRCGQGKPLPNLKCG